MLEKYRSDEMIEKYLKENGKLLRKLIKHFNGKKTEENLFGVLKCFSNINVWIPVEEGSNKPEKKKEIEARRGSTVTRENDVVLVPDYIYNGKNMFLPVFSDIKTMGKKYAKEITKIEVSATEACDMALKKSKAVGIVIDPFTQPCIIPRDSLQYVKNLRDGVDEKGNKIRKDVHGNPIINEEKKDKDIDNDDNVEIMENAKQPQKTIRRERTAKLAPKRMDKPTGVSFRDENEDED